MRIAFVVNNYPPRMGGLESHVSSLARHLVDGGHEVFVHTLAAAPEATQESGIDVTRYPEYFQVGSVLGFPQLGTARKLRRALREQQIDVVSVHTRFFPLSWIGSSAARRLGIPAVHTEHGSGFVVSDSRLISFASKLVDLTLGRRELRRVNHVLGVSENVLDFVRQLSGREGELFYNAIEASGAPALQSEELRRNHFVFVGRLVAGKGWEVFVDVVARLSSEGHEVTAEVLGDGPDMTALRERVDQSGMRSRIDIRGRVDALAVRKALRGATLVNPTVLAEGFQTTLLEALAEGGCVVTYPVAGALALAEQSSPVRITDARSPESLHAALAETLTRPPAPAEAESIDGWTWPRRSAQFVEVCERLIGQR